MSNRSIYEAARARITDLTKNADVVTPVPACPGWSVKDVVAHLAGSLGAYISGDVQSAGSPTWGDDQVNERRDSSLEDCLAEWEATAARADEIFESRLGPVAMADVLAHEQDIRSALDLPSNLDRDGILASLDLAFGFLEHNIGEAGLPALRFVTDEIDRTIGEGAPRATLNTSSFELWRSLHGRRSEAQVRALQWEGDPTPFMDTFFVFGPAETEITE